MYIRAHCVSAILAQAVLAQACLLETGIFQKLFSNMIIRGRWNFSRHGSGSRPPALPCRAPCSK